MNTLTTNRLFNDVFTNWDRAFFDGDHSYWRRDNTVKGQALENSYEYYVPLPGFKKENIKVTVKDGEVYLLAKQGDDTASYSFLIPEDADPSKLSAKHEDGLLTISVEKLEETKAIEIKVK